MTEIYDINCGYSHENPAGLPWKSRATTERILACIFRKGGNNISCVHLGIQLPGEKDNVLKRIRGRIQELGVDHLSYEVDELQALKSVMDDCVRRSYMLGDIPYFKSPTPDLGKVGVIAEALTSIESILGGCNIVSIDKDGDPLDVEQRKSLQRLVLLIQREISRGFAQVIRELDLSESEEISKNLK